VQAARAFATLDQITGGRIRLHAVTGHAPEAEYGDSLSDKNERYARADEYLGLLRRTWLEDEPFDHEGRFYSVRGGFSPVKPLQKPHIPVSLGGSSDAAYEVAVRHTDLYALWAEPLADTAARIEKLRAVAAAAGRPAPRVSLSVRLIIGATEELAWKKAREIAATLERNTPAGAGGDRGQSGGGQRQLALAARAEVFDKALFLGTSTAIGGGTDSTSLVGTPDTIIESLLAYADIGVTTFLSRGYDPLHDAIDYGRYIIPAVREEIRRRERAAA
jgi:alkanesulfonate monooxygenase